MAWGRSRRHRRRSWRRCTAPPSRPSTTQPSRSSSAISASTSSAARLRSSPPTSSRRFRSGPRSSRPRAPRWSSGTMNIMERQTPLARNVRRLGHLDLAGAGQVTVAGSHAYVGHIPNKRHLGTSIIDISDPRNPRTVAEVILDDHDSHSHKVRVVGDIMIVNHERNPTGIGRRADELPRVLRELEASLGRAPKVTEIAGRLGVTEAGVQEIEAEAKRGYHMGGFKIYDVSNPAQPKEIVHQKTGGIGVHRFDMDANY